MIFILARTWWSFTLGHCHRDAISCLDLTSLAIPCWSKPPSLPSCIIQVFHLTLSKWRSMAWSTQKQRTTVIYNENSQIIFIIEDSKTKYMFGFSVHVLCCVLHFFFFFDQRVLHCSWDMSNALRQVNNVLWVWTVTENYFFIVFSFQQNKRYLNEP